MSETARTPLQLVSDERTRVAPDSITTLEKVSHDLLLGVGEDPAREGLLRTPHRFARAMLDLTRGYDENLDQIVNGAVFEESYSEMVLVKRIEFYSLCEHHLLPFFGRAYVAYVPRGKIIGVSKIPRVVHMFARRLQIQERLTTQIADALVEVLNPYGVACMIDAHHMCMMMRGVEEQSSSMITNSMRGVFLSNPATRNEFLSLVHADGVSRG